eukprot:TRINITY_DN5440_c0_g1_i1.p1 TRINITY_DN5440_c0_g1~~TRINITY_DN5440_c0_g1_i1.p1  ORF type:complete len:227 (+),score=31.19 TRINITY_DN5440_c0_g1_i1:100-780(+)
MTSTLTEKELASINELKKAIQDIVKEKKRNIDQEQLEQLTDKDYLRFLHARNFQLKDSLPMMLEALEWRKQNKVDSVSISEAKEEFLKGKVFFHKRDKEGRLVSIIKVSMHRPKESDPEQTKRLCIWFMEQGRKMSGDVDKCTLIFDMSNFGLSNMDYGFVKFLIKVFADYYPDTLGACLIFNSPFLFWGCWKIISPWIDPATRNKTKFVNKNEMLAVIDLSLIHI